MNTSSQGHKSASTRRPSLAVLRSLSVTQSRKSKFNHGIADPQTLVRKTPRGLALVNPDDFNRSSSEEETFEDFDFDEDDDEVDDDVHESMSQRNNQRGRVERGSLRMSARPRSSLMEITITEESGDASQTRHQKRGSHSKVSTLCIYAPSRALVSMTRRNSHITCL
jgi:hypothetical protein